MKHTDHSLIQEKAYTNYYAEQGWIYGITFALASFHSFNQSHASAVSLAETHKQHQEVTDCHPAHANTLAWLTILIS